MPEFAGRKGAYIGQGESQDPISPNEAPGDRVEELFTRHAKRFEKSRDRILLCREVRRNEHLIPVDKDWTQGNEALAEWVQAVLPERQMIPLNLTNMLASEQPVYTRNPRKQTDQAIREADELETWLESMRRDLIDHDEIVGKLTEDSEVGVVVMPSPAALEFAPDYMITIDDERTPDPQYDRDDKGKKPSESGYSKRSERASIAAWREAYKEALASVPPFVVRIIPATDCVPILVRGRGKQRWECRGLLTRTLFEREELISRKFRWDQMDNRELIPRGFSKGRSSGQDGQFYLYEAYLIHVDDDGTETPFIARSVGGYQTRMQGDDGEETSATINLREEYGITRLMATYAWGLHHADDDPDFRGVPILYPLIQTIFNVEGLTTAANAHANDNAFTGHVGIVDSKLPATSYLDTEGSFQKFEKPKSNEIKMIPGQAEPWAQARVGDDVWRLITQHRATLQLNIPDESQTGGKTDSSGHALVVSHELLQSAKRQIREGHRYLVEFIGECFTELACGMARGAWEALNGHGVNVPAMADVERTVASGKSVTQQEIIEFKEHWVKNNYKITADYPQVGNLADRSQKLEGWKVGAVTWDEMREAFGDTHPETSRMEILRDKVLQSPVGELMLMAEIFEEQKNRVLAEMVKHQLAGELTKMGVPLDALPPELRAMATPDATMAGGPAQLQPGQPTGQPMLPSGGMPGGPTQLGDMAQQSLNGAISGEVGQAARQADSVAQVAVNPGQV